MDQRVEVVDGPSRKQVRNRRYRSVSALLILAIASALLFLVQRPVVVRERALAEAVLISETFIEALSGGNHEVVETLVADGAEISINPARSPRDLEMTMAWMEATGWQFRTDRCTASDRGTEEGSQRVLCLLSQENAWSKILGLPPDTRSALTLEVGAGQIEGALLSSAPMSFRNESVISFEAWLRENHPEDEQRMYAYTGLPLLSAESIDLWGRHTEEFVAERS